MAAVDVQLRMHGVTALRTRSMTVSMTGRRAVGGGGPARKWRPPSTGPCSIRCVRCSGCWAKRRWKTLENEILREALDLAQPKTAVVRALAGARRHAVKAIAEALGVARSNLIAQTTAAEP
jgi:hypothetical protein